MTPTVDTTVTAIDDLIDEPTAPAGCHKCGRSVADSPSDEFCSENCQTAWHNEHPAAATPVEVRPGHEVLDEVAKFVRRFSVFPDEHCAPTLALWYAHTHMASGFYVTPRVVLDSAEPASGKTRVLEVAQYLVAAPEMTISATPAALFRLVSEGPITILFDEVDAIFNPKSGGNNEDLRGMLNAGYKRGASIARCIGDAKAMKVQRFRVFAPAMLAGIAGGMPATITTRAITIHMRRRRNDEQVDEFWEEDAERDATPLRATLGAWIGSVADQVATARPPMPAGVRDRPAEIWRPLIAVADAAGGHWPETARAACRHFVLDAGPQLTSTGVRLLADLRTLYTTSSIDRMTSADIITALLNLEESAWGDLHGRPLDARRLSKELGRFGVQSKNLKQPGGGVLKGYRIDGDDGLADAWSRYLPADPATGGDQ